MDWLNKDWAKRECLDWESHSGPRPLATKLMAVPEYKQFFIQYLHYLTEDIVSPNALFPYIDQMHALISPAAQADYYRTLDYNYDFNDFNNSITQTIDNHTPYGIKPFLETRRNYTLQQLDGLVSTELSGAVQQRSGFELWPNPANQSVTISDPLHLISWVTICDATGRVLSTQMVERHLLAHTLPIGHLPNGLYFILTENGARSLVKF